jgi:hypothetical protein
MADHFVATLIGLIVSAVSLLFANIQAQQLPLVNVQAQQSSDAEPHAAQELLEESDDLELGLDLKGSVREFVDSVLDRLEAEANEATAEHAVSGSEVLPSSEEADSGCTTEQSSGDGWSRTVVRCQQTSSTTSASHSTNVSSSNVVSSSSISSTSK